MKSPKVGKDLSEQDASNFTSAKLGNIHKTFSMIEDDCLDIYEKSYKNSFDGLLCEGVVSYQQLARETSKNKAKVLEKTEDIYKMTSDVIKLAFLNQITTHQAALNIAKKRIEDFSRVKSTTFK